METKQYAYIVYSDCRENHDVILGLYKSESSAYAKLGQYHREHNTEDDMYIKGLHEKPISDMSDGEVGETPLSQWSCIIGSVEKREIKP